MLALAWRFGLALLPANQDYTRHCRLRRVLVDKAVRIPEDTAIGYDLEYDRRRGFVVTEQGVVVVPKAEPPETFHGKP